MKKVGLYRRVTRSESKHLWFIVEQAGGGPEEIISVHVSRVNALLKLKNLEKTKEK